MSHPPGSGKHHKRHGNHGNDLRLTASDIRWVICGSLFPPALVMTIALPHTLIWVTLMLVGAVGALTFRLTRQQGDRHYTTPSNDQEAPCEVLIPKVIPTPEETEAQARAKVRSLAIMATLSGVLLTFAKYSQRQADKSRQMHDEIDEQLGLPGTRLGYGDRYQASKPQAWVQPPITGWNWQARLDDERKRREI